ncbi:hypothetical protein Tco_1506644, partial [Tanacetum coccineum]
MHILYVLSTFLTSTRLEIHVGYRTGLTMPALTYSSTSFIIALLFSRIQDPPLLCYQSNAQVHIQDVLDDSPRDSNHVRGLHGFLEVIAAQ